VVATEIDDLDAAGGKTGGALQILLRRHQVLGRVIGGPVLDIFNNQNDVRHDAPLAGGMRPLRSFWAKAWHCARPCRGIFLFCAALVTGRALAGLMCPSSLP